MTIDTAIRIVKSVAANSSRELLFAAARAVVYNAIPNDYEAAKLRVAKAENWDFWYPEDAPEPNHWLEA